MAWTLFIPSAAAISTFGSFMASETAADPAFYRLAWASLIEDVIVLAYFSRVALCFPRVGLSTVS